MFIQSAIRLLTKGAQFLTDIVRRMPTLDQQGAMTRVLLVSLLATLLGGCVIVPWGYGHRSDDNYRGDTHRAWHDHGNWNGRHDWWPGG